jgi:hypothetical protein
MGMNRKGRKWLGATRELVGSQPGVEKETFEDIHALNAGGHCGYRKCFFIPTAQSL